MTTNAIRTVYQCTLKLITPLHIGTGEKLSKGLDFVCQSRKIHILNTNKMFSAVEELGTGTINAFTKAIETNTMEEWLGENKILADSIASHSFPWDNEKLPSTIHVQIKDGMANPIIPGSSLKGALRTAIVRKLATGHYQSILKKEVDDLSDLKKNGPTKTNEADKELLKKILGNEPNINLMRVLTVGDFTFPRSDLGLQEVLVSRLKSPTGTKLYPKNNIVVERLSAKAFSCGVVSFDDYLATACNSEKKYLATKETIDLPWLLDACHQLTLHTIDTELAFFKDKTGTPADELRVFYTSLAQKLKTLDKKSEAIIQMAWGTGWRGITGQLLKEDECRSPVIRNKLKLAPKYLDFPFPKSRKAALPEDKRTGKALPMGWVKLSFKPMDEVRREAEENTQWQAMDEAGRDLACIRQEAIALKFASVVTDNPCQTIWERLDSAPPEHKMKLALAFKERWQREGRWQKTKKKSKHSEKVKKIKGILNFA